MAVWLKVETVEITKGENLMDCPYCDTEMEEVYKEVGRGLEPVHKLVGYVCVRDDCEHCAEYGVSYEVRCKELEEDYWFDRGFKGEVVR